MNLFQGLNDGQGEQKDVRRAAAATPTAEAALAAAVKISAVCFIVRRVCCSPMAWGLYS